MRQLFLATVVASLALGTGSVRADQVELKGVHLCCGQCVKGAAAALSKVDGVSDAKCDQKGKTVSFTAKDAKAAQAGLKSLADAGFFGTATDDGKPVKIEASAAKKGDKSAEVTVKNVHLCCNRCKKDATALFGDAKVDFPAKNVIKISGKDLDKSEVLETLRKAGFNGTVE